MSYQATPMGVRIRGADIFCIHKKFLVFNLVSRNLKIKYRRSFLGLFWTLFSPLAMTAVYYLVFNRILNIQIPHYLLFVLSGVLTWNFISQTILEGMESIVNNIHLVRKVPVPVQIFPFVGTVTNFTTFLFAHPILFAVSWLSGVQPSFALLLLPFYLSCLLLLTYGLSLILSILFIRLQDLRHLVGILLQIWFYATPIVYDEKMIPAKFEWVLYANPFGCLFSDWHRLWVTMSLPPSIHVLTVACWTAGIVTLSMSLFRAFSQGIIEDL